MRWWHLVGVGEVLPGQPELEEPGGRGVEELRHTGGREQVQGQGAGSKWKKPLWCQLSPVKDAAPIQPIAVF